jgi:hypothetical protein
MSPHRVLSSLPDLCDQTVSPDKSNCRQRYSQTDFVYCPAPVDFSQYWRTQ